IARAFELNNIMPEKMLREIYVDNRFGFFLHNYRVYAKRLRVKLMLPRNLQYRQVFYEIRLQRGKKRGMEIVLLPFFCNYKYSIANSPETPQSSAGMFPRQAHERVLVSLASRTSFAISPASGYIRLAASRQMGRTQHKSAVLKKP
ncbi:MAG: hypothetical protein LBR83_00290, partial [Clostridiales bacterium]|nr:hypothetical protein [Clostridiales bacterium]